MRGGKLCVWCAVELRKPRRGDRRAASATIDHYDNNPDSNASTNLLGSCRGCNRKREFGTWKPPAAAEARARVLLARPLDLVAGRALAERWHPGREEQVEDCRRRYREKMAAKNADFDPATLE